MKIGVACLTFNKEFLEVREGSLFGQNTKQSYGPW
jgi:hypothetical protein